MDYRSATHADGMLLASMNAALIQDEGHRNSMTLPELQARMAGWLDGEYEAVVFSKDDADVGYCLYKLEPEWIYLRQLFVKRDYRRQGFGRAALEWLTAHQWKEASRIRIEVLVDNSAAIAFWRSVGFVDYCTTMEFVRS